MEASCLHELLENIGSQMRTLNGTSVVYNPADGSDLTQKSAIVDELSFIENVCAQMKKTIRD